MTAAELGRRMSAYEQMEWAVFESEFGPLTLQERIDAMAGHISGNAVEWRTKPQAPDIIGWLSAKARR